VPAKQATARDAAAGARCSNPADGLEDPLHSASRRTGGDPRGSLRSRPLRPLGVYVHFPWCLAKCPYCDFLSVAAPRDSIPHEAYADAVIAEIARRAAWAGPRRLASVFFGGGTPSLWEPRQLGRVLAAIRAAFPRVEEPLEVTAECNPSSLDAARARALVAEGVTRLSVGVQGLRADRLGFLGRLHDARGALSALRAAVGSGAARVSADLIFGVCGQSPREAAEEASCVADTGIGHVSAYALTVEPGTRFGALAREGRLPLCPEPAVADSFDAVREALARRGFEHYEISNFARPGQRSRHNLGYWLGHDYLGVGAGAWGTLCRHDGSRRLRWRNTPAVDRYTGSAPAWQELDLERRSTLVAELESLDATTALAERVMLGLRLSDGVDVDAAARELGADPWPPRRRRAVERLVARGRLLRDAGRLRIPAEAWLLADGTISELL
jgi:oxygen-independent coproporphyrinogen-3 oxidase